MADTKISELTEVVSPLGTDMLPIVSGGETKKVKVENLTGAAAGALLIANNLSDLDDVAVSRDNLGLGDLAVLDSVPNDSITYAKIQNVTATDKLLGRSTAGAGDVEEIPCTAAGRALLDDADATAQRTTLGLGTLATQNGTFSGTSSGTNTGDQDLSGLQPLDGDLTAIAALSPTNDDVIQRKAGVWTNRTPAQVKTDLALVKSDVGLSNVDNTSDLSKPISTATQTALDLKVDENAAITGATKTKVTYDAKGLVTAGGDATTADIADSTNKRYVTDAQLTVLGNTSGTNTGDQVLTSVLASSIVDGDTTHAPDGNSVFDALALKANDADVVHDTGDETVAGVKTFSSDPIIPDEAYGVGWNGSLEPPTKNALYDKIETLGTAGVGGSTGATDNAILRADGTGGATVQSSGVLVNDAGALVIGDAVLGNSVLDFGVGGASFKEIRMGDRAGAGVAAIISNGGAGETVVVVGRADGAVRINATHLSFTDTINPTMVANTAGLFAKDVTGTVEMFAIDEAGNVTQISAHAFDGPSWLYDADDPLPQVLKEENIYLGIRRWTNRSRQARLLERMFSGENIAALPLEQRTFIHVETFSPPSEWDADQVLRQTLRETERSEWEQRKAEQDMAIATWEALSPEEKEKQPRPEPLSAEKPPTYIAKPKPSWIAERLEK